VYFTTFSATASATGNPLGISWSTQDIYVLPLLSPVCRVHYANYCLVPHKYILSSLTHIVPYLKEGKHGPGGDFDNDRDRMTGKGHNYQPNDAKLYEEYLQNRAVFRKMHPAYPQLREGEVVDAEVKADRHLWEEWYFGFRERYPGSLGDQWVCGCQKWTEESEDESEEE
jgi:hypothetical protein